MVNLAVIKLNSDDDPDEDEIQAIERRSRQPSVLRTDAFTVLPPLSPKIPGPPRTPEPYRLVPPAMADRKPSFVIIQEAGSRPVSRDASPINGRRLSPFRGYGFKPPAPSKSRENIYRSAAAKTTHRSRSRVPVLSSRNSGACRKVSKSASPIRSKIPRPLNRRISYSPGRTEEVLSRLDDKPSLSNKNRVNISQRAASTAAAAKQQLPLTTNSYQPGLSKLNQNNSSKADTNESKKPTEPLTNSSQPSKPVKRPADQKSPFSTKKHSNNGNAAAPKPGAVGTVAFHQQTQQKPVTAARKNDDDRTKKPEGSSSPAAAKSDIGKPPLPEKKTVGKFQYLKSKPRTSPGADARGNSKKTLVESPIVKKAVQEENKSSSSLSSSQRNYLKSNSSVKTKKEVLPPRKSANSKQSLAGAATSSADAQQCSGDNVESALIQNGNRESAPTSLPSLMMATVEQQQKTTMDSLESEKSDKSSTSTLKQPTDTKPSRSKIAPKRILTPASIISALKRANVKKELIIETDETEDHQRVVAVDDADKRSNGSVAEKISSLQHSDTMASLPILGSPKITEATLVRTTTEPVLAPLEHPDIVQKIRSATATDAGGVIFVPENEAVSGNDKENNKIGPKTNESPSSIGSFANLIDCNDSKIKENAIQSANELIEGTTNYFCVGDGPAEDSEVEKRIIDNSTGVKEAASNSKAALVAASEQPIVGRIKQDPEFETLSANTLQHRMENRRTNGISHSLASDVPKHTEMPTISAGAQDKTCWRTLISKCSNCCRCCDCCSSESTKSLSLISLLRNCRFSKSRSFDVSCCCCFKCRRKVSSGDNETADNKRSIFRALGNRCVTSCYSTKEFFSEKFSRTKKKPPSNEPNDLRATEDDDDDDDDGDKSARCNDCGGRKSLLRKCCGSYLCCFSCISCPAAFRCSGDTRRSLNCCKRTNNNDEPEQQQQQQEDNVISIDVEQSMEMAAKSNRKTIKKSWTRCFRDIPKLDISFVEHGSIMRGSIPVLPIPLAWMCLVLNIFLPGSGTLLSGMFCLCFGKPRYSVNDSMPARIGSFFINLLVAASQLFTVLFCLVGWGWSIWWGVLMLRMAKKNQKILLAERAMASDNERPRISLNQNHDVERAIPTG